MKNIKKIIVFILVFLLINCTKNKENYNLEIVTPNIYDQTHIWTITINTQENIDLFYEIYIWDIENYLVKNTFELSKNQLCSSIFSKFKYSKYIIITANNCN